MQPQSDRPKFPHVSGDLEHNEAQGRKGVFGKALFKTFVQPSLDQVSWKARQFAPKQMAFNMLSATPFGQKLLDLKGNYEFAKDPSLEGFNNTDVTTNGASRGNSGGSSPYMNQEMKALVETIQAGMSTMTTELKNVRRSVDSLQKTNVAGISEQTGTKTKVTELVDLFRSILSRDKFSNKEKALNQEHGVEELAKKDMGKNWLADLIAAVVKFKVMFLGGLAAVRSAAAAGFTRITSGITKMFSAIRLPSMGPMIKAFGKITGFGAALGALTAKIKLPDMPKVGNLFNGLAKIGDDIKRLIAPLGKIAPRLLRIVGRFGVITTVIMAAVDGIVGFFKGWGDTDGPIYKKFAAGFDGAIQGIAKGILEIPKMLLQALKFIGTSIIDMLGFKRLAEAMREFNLGDWWDRTIGGFVEKFDIAQSMVKIGERVVDIFLNICEFIVKKLTGVTINLRGDQRSSSEDGGRRSLGDMLRDAIAGRSREAASDAPSGGANRGAAAVADGGARARAGAASVVSTGGAGGRAALGVRNNNPGNIEFNRNNNWVGQTGRGEGGRFSAFDSPENGIRAIGRLLQTYDKQGVNTLAGIVNKWAPAADNNDVGAYVRTLERHTGLAPNQKIDLQDPATLQSIVRGIIAQENGPSSSRISDAQVQEGVRLALGGISRADARPNAGQPPRVDNNTSALQRGGAAVVAVMRPFIPPAVSAPVINNMISTNQNNTISPQRPRAVNPNASPGGPRS